jgi:hypothetical protein
MRRFFALVFMLALSGCSQGVAMDPPESQIEKDCDAKIKQQYGYDLSLKSNYIKGVYRGYYCSK